MSSPAESGTPSHPDDPEPTEPASPPQADPSVAPPGSPEGQLPPPPDLRSVDMNTDLGGGIIPTSTAESVSEQVRDSQQRRELRKTAFWGLGGVAVLYLLVLLALMTGFLGDTAALAIIARAADWHVLVVVGMAFVIMAAIPLSIALALFRMVASSHETTSGGDLKITTPQVELFRAFLEAFKVFRSG